MVSLEKYIFTLEDELLKTETRQSPERIAELLSEDFMEFCSSGNIYNYKKGDVFSSGDSIEKIDWEIRDFSIRELSEDTVLAVYKLIKNDDDRRNMKYSLRCSIWKCFDGSWKIIFHQGTPASEKK